MWFLIIPIAVYAFIKYGEKVVEEEKERVKNMTPEESAEYERERQKWGQSFPSDHDHPGYTASYQEYGTVGDSYCSYPECHHDCDE